MIRLGITGGIGSGKSTASDLFASFGVPVYRSDDRAKELMESLQHLREGITGLFGSEAFANGRLNRRLIAEKVFSDRSLLRTLNGLVHPAVKADFEKWASEQTDAPYVALECAILFESGFDALVDRIVTVSAPLEVRVERASRRDGCSPDAVRRRIANQTDDGQRESRSDFVVANTTPEALHDQIETIHHTLLHENR